ncbi:coiled-coil protein [Legionella longbeachae]|nr:coiled-coil protein [Legionella oakridgensis]STY15826.1 coiled-coil protein [Legionella longbeachae]
MSMSKKDAAMLSAEEKLALGIQDEDVLALLSIGTLSEKIKLLQEGAKGETPSENSVWLSIIKRLPFITDLVSRINKGGNVVTQLITLKKGVTAALSTAGTAIHGIGIGVAAIDFLRIPGVYIASAIAGQRPPLTLSKAGKFTYSSVILALAVMVIAFPPAAPFIGIAAAALGMGASVFTMAKLSYDRRQTKKKLVPIKEEIENINKELDAVAQEAQHLEDKLERLNKGEILDINKNALESRLAEIKEESYEKLKILNALNTTKLQYEAKLKKMGATAFMDKGVAIGLGLLALAGAVVVLFFPPAGLAMMGAALAGGISYMVGRAVFPYAKKLATYLRSKEKKKDQTNFIVVDEDKDKEEDNFFMDEIVCIRHPGFGILKGQETNANASKRLEIQEDAQRLMAVVREFPVIDEGLENSHKQVEQSKFGFSPVKVVQSEEEESEIEREGTEDSKDKRKKIDENLWR